MSSPRPRQKRPTRTAAEDGEDISPDPIPEDFEDTEDAAAITERNGDRCRFPQRL